MCENLSSHEAFLEMARAICGGGTSSGEDDSNDDAAAAVAELELFVRQAIAMDSLSREKLRQYNTFDDAVELFRRSRKIIFVTGAGISVSSGIPDFRSQDGIYSRLRIDYPDLPRPSAMFEMDFFKSNPKPFYEFAREMFPGRFKPTTSHRFIKAMESENKLLRNYTQNIDTLESLAGIQRVVFCHGSFSSATCLRCRKQVPIDDLRDDVMNKRVARCKKCVDDVDGDGGIMKPDIVFFGEDLPETFHKCVDEDKDEADLLVVVGSSMKVFPVALLPYRVNPDVPQILINREPLSHYQADIELLGNSDDIIEQLALALGLPLTQCFDSGSQRGSAICARHDMGKSKFLELMEEPRNKRCRTEDSSSPYTDRFVDVSSKLGHDCYLYIPPGKSIFPGAEMVFDMEYGEFCESSCFYKDDSDDGSSTTPSSTSVDNISNSNELLYCSSGLLDTIASSQSFADPQVDANVFTTSASLPLNSNASWNISTTYSEANNNGSFKSVSTSDIDDGSHFINCYLGVDIVDRLYPTSKLDVAFTGDNNSLDRK